MTAMTAMTAIAAEDLALISDIQSQYGSRAAARAVFMAIRGNQAFEPGLEQLGLMYGKGEDSGKLDWLGVFGKLYHRDFAVRLAAEITGDHDLANHWWNELRACSAEQRRTLAVYLNDLDAFGRAPAKTQKFIRSLDEPDYATIWILLYGCLPAPVRADGNPGAAREAKMAECVASVLGLDEMDYTSAEFIARAHDSDDE